MGIFFRDPLLGLLEEYAFKLAKERYITQGVPLSDDIATWSAETRKAVKAIRAEIFTAQKAEVKKLRKSVGSDYKRVVKSATREALNQALYDSSPSWYSEERGRNPRILAVPVAVIRDRVRERLPAHLRKHNQFMNPSQEVIEAIADDATERYLEAIVGDAIDGDDTFTVSYEDYSLIELIPDDFYLVDDDGKVKRLHTLILAHIDNPRDKDRARKSKKESSKLWKKHIRRNERSDKRVFQTAPWHLDETQVAELKRRDA